MGKNKPGTGRLPKPPGPFARLTVTARILDRQLEGKDSPAQTNRSLNN
jgi:hypothetical protein